ncbi:MAG: radical SAM protein [Alicyclobacillus sp.]|nr:radical SAM protein [Alicyclobacillus sp.]
MTAGSPILAASRERFFDSIRGAALGQGSRRRCLRFCAGVRKREGKGVAAPTYTFVQTKQAMNRVQSPGMPFRWSLNPYRGCTHGCSFCYARSTHSYLGFAADDTFRTQVLVKDNVADALAEQLEQLLSRHRGDLQALRAALGPLAIGTATDPYQPVEAKARRTRACLEVLAHYRIPVSITTRSPLILRDVDLLKRMDVQAINVSVHTLDTQVWRRLEPATPAPLKRLQAVQHLVAHGLPAGVFLAPILPCLTDQTSALEALVKAASVHQARFVIPSVLRLTPEVKSWFFQVIAAHYPQLLPALQRLYRAAYPPQAYTRPLLARIRRLLAHYHVADRWPDATQPIPDPPVAPRDRPWAPVARERAAGQGDGVGGEARRKAGAAGVPVDGRAWAETEADTTVKPRDSMQGPVQLTLSLF